MQLIANFPMSDFGLFWMFFWRLSRFISRRKKNIHTDTFLLQLYLSQANIFRNRRQLSHLVTLTPSNIPTHFKWK